MPEIRSNEPQYLRTYPGAKSLSMKAIKSKRCCQEDLYRFANHDAVKWKAIKAIADYYEFDTEEEKLFLMDFHDVIVP